MLRVVSGRRRRTDVDPDIENAIRSGRLRRHGEVVSALRNITNITAAHQQPPFVPQPTLIHQILQRQTLDNIHVRSFLMSTSCMVSQNLMPDIRGSRPLLVLYISREDIFNNSNNN